MELKDYGYDLSLYTKTNEELLESGKKLQIAGIIIMLLSLTFFIQGGFIPFVLGLVLFSKKRKYKKIIAQRAFVAELTERIEAPALVDIVPDITKEKDTHRSLAKMQFIDFTPVRKNTPLKKIFPLVIIDVETTGLSRSKDRIVEISAYKYENNFIPTQRFTTLINPKMSIPTSATKINHITDEMVSSSPTFEQITSQFQGFISGCNVAGYNVRFDLEFLYAAGIDFSENVLYFDVYDIAKKKIRKTEIENYKLQTVCKKLGIHTISAHRSGADCFATGEVFETLVMKDRS